MDSELLPVPPGSAPEWKAHKLDLDAYLRRIGYNGPLTPTLDTLRGLHRAHATTISWEIVDVTLGRDISVDLEAVQDKIVYQGRGGCCLETNLLFAAALERIGFPIVRHLARVRRGNTRLVRTRSHLVLLVEAEQRLWLADPGFGDESPLEPIEFTDGASLTVGGWVWRLDSEGGEWIVRSEHEDGWFDVYAMRLEKHHPIDVEMIVHFSMVDPRSVFLGKLVVQCADENARHVLRDRQLVTTHPDYSTTNEELSGEGIVRALRELFRIDISETDERLLRQRYASTERAA